MWTLVLAALAWAEPTVIEVERSVVPVFPSEAQALGLTEARCKVKVTIDAKGWATDVEPTDCPTAFITTAVTTLKAWKWAPPRTPSGEPVKEASFAHVLRFELETDRVYPLIDSGMMAQLKAAHEPSPAEGEGCIVGVRMRSDSSVDRLASNDVDNCLVIPSGNLTYPVGKKEVVTCHADFKVLRGHARELNVSWCPTNAAKQVDRMLRQWQWLVVGEDAVPYHVELTFEP